LRSSKENFGARLKILFLELFYFTFLKTVCLKLLKSGRDCTGVFEVQDVEVFLEVGIVEGKSPSKHLIALI
jgi:hypothetical protein